MRFEIRQDDLSGTEIQALLREHLAGMQADTPPESVHALPLEALRQPGITLWSAWHGDRLCGCGALKTLDARHGELKSMRTHGAFLRQGVGQAVLDHIMAQARARGLLRLSLETGTAPSFAAAHALYRRNGFLPCGPFADYRLDPHSLFMSRQL